jgi:hypothetical protein
MSREKYLAAAEELGLENHPLVRDVLSLLYASHEDHMKSVNEQRARIGRMHKALGDEVVGFGERRRGDV